MGGEQDGYCGVGRRVSWLRHHYRVCWQVNWCPFGCKLGGLRLWAVIELDAVVLRGGGRGCDMVA